MASSASLLAVVVICLAMCCGGVQSRMVPGLRGGSRTLQELVPDQPLVLDYHGGAVLGGASINVYLLWYGDFTPAQKAIITDFVLSFGPSSTPSTTPSVQSWWKLTAAYTDSKGVAVPSVVALAGQAVDAGSLGKNLKDADLERLVKQALDGKQLPVDPQGLYFVLTSADVLIESFCRNSCGTHSVVTVGAGTKLPYAWVGNSAQQCPGMCAWPFAPLPYQGASATAAAKSPNGDVGLDGMVINFAALLAGASTNPFGNAYYQGNALAPLEAGTACPGNYGAGSYPGYPGSLLTVSSTGGNYNVNGVRPFLVPALVNRATAACAISV